MENPAIFSATLGLSHPWKVTTVTFSGKENRLDINVDFDFGKHFACPCCGREIIPVEGPKETWHHRDFLHYPTYLHATIPHIECPCGGILAVDRPWSRPGSRFTLLQ